MNFWYAILLGLVEGATEFLPVSSTAHLLLTQRLMGLSGDGMDAFAVVIQLGALLSVVVYYRHQIFSLATEIVKTKKPIIQTTFVKIVVASFPVLLVGLFFGSFIKKKMFFINILAIFLFAGGVIIFLVEQFFPWSKEGKSIESLSLKESFQIGCFQVFSLFPGMSRSLVTLLGGRALGLSKPAAIDMTFLLAIPTLTAASCYSLIKYASVLYHEVGIGFICVGLLSSFISGLCVVHFMIRLVRKIGLSVFGIYRVLLAISVWFFW